MEKLIYFEDNKLKFIDQTKLPCELVVDTYTEYHDVCDAIKRLKVRGAPAIGVAAGYGVVVASNQFFDMDINEHKDKLGKAIEDLAATRPTAVNLFWALNRQQIIVDSYQGKSVEELTKLLLDEANKISDEDFDLGHKLGAVGAGLLQDGQTVMTICNAGSLATGGIGSALACVHVAKELGKNVKVYSLETRPLLQGARLTTWELHENGIDVTLITDSMAAMVLSQGKIDLIITGADRIAANGDSANKIGTFGLSILAKHHNVPFYIAAPKSTFDFELSAGSQIPIEERSADELRYFNGKQIAPLGVNVYNPAFDVTPAEHIKGIITEDGILEAPYADNIKKLWG